MIFTHFQWGPASGNVVESPCALKLECLFNPNSAFLAEDKAEKQAWASWKQDSEALLIILHQQINSV